MINTTDLETTDKMIPIHVGNGSAEDLDLFNDCCIPFIALRWPTARSKTHSSLHQASSLAGLCRLITDSKEVSFSSGLGHSSSRALTRLHVGGIQQP